MGNISPAVTATYYDITFVPVVTAMPTVEEAAVLSDLFVIGQLHSDSENVYSTINQSNICGVSSGQEIPIKTMIVAGTGATKRDEIDNCQHVSLTLLYICLPTTVVHVAMRAHKPQVVSDWLNPDSLGTISAFGDIDKLA